MSLYPTPQGRTPKGPPPEFSPPAGGLFFEASVGSDGVEGKQALNLNRLPDRPAARSWDAAIREGFGDAPRRRYAFGADRLQRVYDRPPLIGPVAMLVQ